MTRVKTGPYRKQHHKKVLKLTKGQFGTRHRLFKHGLIGTLEQTVAGAKLSFSEF
jgi:ribosomal protein L20